MVIDLQQIITIVLATAGGTTGLGFALALLVRKLISHNLDKDIELFRVQLKAGTDVEIERLRSSLEIASFEHQIRFTKLHEKQAQVIAELYAHLVELLE